MTFDLLLKGGHLIDPANNIDAGRDLAITDGRIAAVDADIPTSCAGKVIDVSGLVVTPGLVDIHTHMFATSGFKNAWAGDRSILPDGFSFRSGVTAMVDTGSAGWRMFEDFRYRVLDRFETRMFAFLNIVGMGMVSNDMEQNHQDMQVDPAVAILGEEPGDRLGGVVGPDDEVAQLPGHRVLRDHPLTRFDVAADEVA